MTTLPSLDSLRPLVINCARDELLPRFKQVARRFKSDGSIVTEADLAVQQRLASQLRARWPHIRFLGEEMASDEQTRLLAGEDPLWCLDPLDGTSNFASGIPFFAVSLALLQHGRVVLGLVYDPMRDECFGADASGAAWLNGQPLQLENSGLELQHCIAVVDFKRLPAELAGRLATARPYASQRSFGSVALDWCWLAADRGHVYLHGRQNLWDYAAGHFIFQRAGGHACTLDGEDVFTPSLTPRSALAAGDAALFQQWRSWIGDGKLPQ